MNKKSLFLLLLSPAIIKADAVSDWFKKVGSDIESGGKKVLSTIEETGQEAISTIQGGLQQGVQAVQQGAQSTENMAKDIGRTTQEIIKKTEQQTQDLLQKVKSGLEHPDKIALAVAKDAVKVAGIDIDGIERSVNSLKGSVDTIKTDVDTIKESLQAPTSPLTKAKEIAPQLQRFQRQAVSLAKSVNIGDIKKAIASPKALISVVATMATPSLKSDLQELYGSYDAILTTVDAVDIRPVVGSMETTLRDAAQIIDTAMDIITYAGAPGGLVNLVVGSPIIDSTKSISRDLKTIANDLGMVKRGGLISARGAQVDFAKGLISNLPKLMPLVTSMQKKPAEVLKQVGKITPLVAKMKGELDQLQQQGVGIEGRLKDVLADKIKTIQGAFDLPRAAIAELRSIVENMRNQLTAMLGDAADIVNVVAQLINSGVDGIDAVEQATGFNLLPAASRTGIQPLSADVARLSQDIGNLRTAIKNR